MSGSNCCTPGASSRSRRCRSRWRSTSKAISGRSSSSRRQTCIELFGLDVQELAIWRPLVESCRGTSRARPAGAGGARFVLPAGHGGHGVPARAREIDGRGDRHRCRRNGGWATSTIRAITNSTGEDFANVFRLHGEPRTPTRACRRTWSSSNATRADPATATTWYGRRSSCCGDSCDCCRRRIRSSNSGALRGRPGMAGRRGAGDVSPVFVRHAAAIRRCYELAATYLRWLEDRSARSLARPIAAFTRHSDGGENAAVSAGARRRAREAPRSVRHSTDMAETNGGSRWTNLKESFL